MSPRKTGEVIKAQSYPRELQELNEMMYIQNCVGFHRCNVASHLDPQNRLVVRKLFQLLDSKRKSLLMKWVPSKL